MGTGNGDGDGDGVDASSLLSPFCWEDLFGEVSSF